MDAIFWYRFIYIISKKYLDREEKAGKPSFMKAFHLENQAGHLIINNHNIQANKETS